MKKVEPKDLIVGQEYYVKMKFNDENNSHEPLCFLDIKDNRRWFTKDQPIYTASEESDIDLKTVVEVASMIYVTRNLKPELCAREAIDLISACKQIKEGER